MNRIGNIVEFKRTGFVSRVLGGILKLFEPSWSGWGWHLAILWNKVFDGWYILEATGQGVKIKYYRNKYLNEYARIYQWLDKAPTRKKMNGFLAEHINDRYDAAVYFWTGLAIIIRHFWNRPIPKLLDERWSCWELIQDFTEAMNDPILSKYDVVIITDVIKALQSKTLQ